MRMMMRRPDFQPPPVLDLRQDGASPISTIITIYADYRGHAWIHAGGVDLAERDRRHGLWDLRVKVRGATDFEHDTAIALSLNLTGVAFRMARGDQLWLDGYIAGEDPEAFRVPEPGWNQLEGAIKCTHKDCQGKDARHVIVGEGRYVPPSNKALFERLRGFRVEIITGIG